MQCDDKICQFRSRSVSVGVGGASCPLCHHGKMQEEVYRTPTIWNVVRGGLIRVALLVLSSV